jgi:hypothetical protein
LTSRPVFREQISLHISTPPLYYIHTIEHAEAIEEVWLAEYQMEQGQLDGLWAYVTRRRPQFRMTGEELMLQRLRSMALF